MLYKKLALPFEVNQRHRAKIAFHFSFAAKEKKGLVGRLEAQFTVEIEFTTAKVRKNNGPKQTRGRRDGERLHASSTQQVYRKKTRKLHGISVSRKARKKSSGQEQEVSKKKNSSNSLQGTKQHGSLRKERQNVSQKKLGSCPRVATQRVRTWARTWKASWN